MARVLVVEDSADQAESIVGLLEAEGHTVELAADGRQGLAAIADSPPDVVVTDLVMPELTGLELVQEVTKRHPSLPVILMTAYGSGEIAMQALRQGAASYVPKSLLMEELTEIVDRMAEMTRARRERERTLLSLKESDVQLVLPTDPSLIPPLVEYVQEMIASCKRNLHETQRTQVGVALEEALLNAVHHGNLEVSSSIREESIEAYLQKIQERFEDPQYGSRHVYLRVKITDSTLTMVVRDDGDGFDLASVPDPTDPQYLLRSSGRGLYLVGTFMDEVSHNETGNEITMVKRLDVQEDGDGGPG